MSFRFYRAKKAKVSVAAKVAAVDLISILECLETEEDKINTIAVLIKVYSEDTEFNQNLRKECKGLKLPS